VSRQQPAALTLKPVSGLLVLAFRAMAVLARVVLILAVLTGRAQINVSPQLGRAASLDIRQSPAMRREQAIAIVSKVFGAVAANDLRQFEHGLSAGRLKAFHQVVERLAGVLLDLVGQMGVEDCRIGGVVPQVFFNGAQVHSIFEQVRGIGMPAMPVPA